MCSRENFMALWRISFHERGMGGGWGNGGGLARLGLAGIGGRRHRHRVSDGAEEVDESGYLPEEVDDFAHPPLPTKRKQRHKAKGFRIERCVEEDRWSVYRYFPTERSMMRAFRQLSTNHTPSRKWERATYRAVMPDGEIRTARYWRDLSANSHSRTDRYATTMKLDWGSEEVKKLKKLYEEKAIDLLHYVVALRRIREGGGR